MLKTLKTLLGEVPANSIAAAISLFTTGMSFTSGCVFQNWQLGHRLVRTRMCSSAFKLLVSRGASSVGSISSTSEEICEIPTDILHSTRHLWSALMPQIPRH